MVGCVRVLIFLQFAAVYSLVKFSTVIFSAVDFSVGDFGIQSGIFRHKVLFLRMSVAQCPRLYFPAATCICE